MTAQLVPSVPYGSADLWSVVAGGERKKVCVHACLSMCYQGRGQVCCGGGKDTTYPQSKVSRTSTYRILWEAYNSAGTATVIHMRALVGRRIQASAASSSDRRNLHKHEPNAPGGGEEREKKKRKGRGWTGCHDDVL